MEFWIEMAAGFVFGFALGNISGSKFASGFWSGIVSILALLWIF